MAKFKIGDHARVIFSIRYPESIGREVRVVSDEYIADMWDETYPLNGMYVYDIEFIDGPPPQHRALPPGYVYMETGSWVCPRDWMVPTADPKIELEEHEEEIA